MITHFWWFHADPNDSQQSFHQNPPKSTISSSKSSESIQASTSTNTTFSTSTSVKDATAIATATATATTTLNDIKSKDPQNWRAFSVHDNERLEAAFLSNNKDNQGDGIDYHCIPVLEDYLYSADLIEMTMKPYYWDDYAVEIRRSCWFYLGNSGKPVPMSRSLNDELEYTVASDEKAKLFFSKFDMMKDLDLEPAEKEPASTEKKDISTSQPSSNNNENVGFVVSLKSPQYSDHFDLVFGTNNDSVFLCDNSKVTRLANSILSLMSVNFNRGQKLCRGYGNLRLIFDKCDLPVPTISCDSDDKVVSFNHLVIVIHGMGQKLALRSGNPERLITASCNQIRSRLKNEALKCHSRVKAMILPIPWRNSLGLEYDDQSLHAMLQAEREIAGKEGCLGSQSSEPESLDALLRAVTLPSVPVVRNVISDVIMDVMLYLNSKFSPRILDLVVSYMNGVYEKFIARHPSFKGKVSIFSHSLGSVITFDILKEIEGQDNAWLSRLKFPVENVFVAGSPISVFLGLEGMKLFGCSRRIPFSLLPSSKSSLIPEIIRPSLVRLECKNFFNIFHPDDPVSYRLEPTICRFAYPKDPFLLPYRKGGLGSIQLSNFINRLRLSFSSVSGKPISEEHIDFPDDEIRSTTTTTTTESAAAAAVAKAVIDEINQLDHLDHPDNISSITDATSIYYETPANTPISSSQAGDYSSDEIDESKQYFSPSATQDFANPLLHNNDDDDKEEDDDLEDDKEDDDKEDDDYKKQENLNTDDGDLILLNPLDTRQWLKTHFNSLGRVDFVLQNPISLTPSLLNSLPAHLLYWKDDDVMSFIHSILKNQ